MKKYSDPLFEQRVARQDRLQAERMVIPVPQVIEDDPETSWNLWQEALSSQEQQGGKPN